MDVRRIESGLRAMGLLYGSTQDLEQILQRESDPASAIREYIKRGRPHLLASYDLEALVSMVLAASDAPDERPAGVEQFQPR